MIDGGWNRPNKTGVWLFMAGAFIGYLLFLMAFIQDTESIVFSANVSGDETLRSLRCPEIITRGETGEIRATISNDTEKSLYRYVRTHISEGYLTFKRELNKSFTQDPGESTTLIWEVSSDDAAWGYLIMTKVYVFRQRPYPSYVGTCGITSLDIPLIRGWQLIVLIAAISVTLMGVGYWKFAKANQPLVRKKRTLARNLVVIAVAVMIGMGSMFLESWYLEIMLFVFTTILLAESAFQFSQKYN